MTFVYLAAALIGALTFFVMAVLQTEFGLPWTVGVPIALPIVLAGIGIARAITVTTDLTFLQAIGGLGLVLYLLAGGYEIVKTTPS